MGERAGKKEEMNRNPAVWVMLRVPGFKGKIKETLAFSSTLSNLLK